jgi:hypothetical protein
MHGGYDDIDEYKVQRLYRDAKIIEINAGDNRSKSLSWRKLYCVGAKRQIPSVRGPFDRNCR